MNFPLLLERSRDWTKDRLDEGKKVCAWVWVCVIGRERVKW